MPSSSCCPTTKLSTISETYYSIICKAINSTETGEMSVTDIYKYLDNNFKRHLNSNWQNSVRHALSYKPYFIHKKSCRSGVWTLDPDYKQDISNQRKKINRKSPDELQIQRNQRTRQDRQRDVWIQMFKDSFSVFGPIDSSDGLWYLYVVCLCCLSMLFMFVFVVYNLIFLFIIILLSKVSRDSKKPSFMFTNGLAISTKVNIE